MKKIILSLFLLIMLSASLFAQVIISTPQVTSVSGTTAVYYDINNDGINDLEIVHESRLVLTVGPAYRTIIRGQNGAEIRGKSYNPHPAYPNDTIYYDHYCPAVALSFDDFLPNSDEYLGFRFMVNSVFHYGYLEMTYDHDGTGTFIDNNPVVYLSKFAYESIPDLGIVAGSINTLHTQSYGALDNTITISPNPTIANTSIILENPENYKTLQVYTSLGNLIMREDIRNREIIHLDLENYPDGIYLIEAMNNKGETSISKIVKTSF